MSQQLPLFVFGTLRRGESNHRYLAGSYERCLPASLKGYRRTMADHGFPTIDPEPDSSVEGELYFLKSAMYGSTMRGCDFLEGIPPGRTDGDNYRRTEVTVETAEGSVTAWAYVDAGR